MGGFESSTHKLKTGQRLDLTGSTRHDRLAARDYKKLRELGVSTVRDAIRWHLIDRGGELDFSSVLPMLKAAEETGTQVIWDIFHFGWPDGLDIFSTEFVRRYARLAREFAKLLIENTNQTPFIAPANEISFVSWAGGDTAYLNPFCKDRGWELKVHLARAAIEAVAEIRGVSEQIRLVYPEPVIHLVGRPGVPGDDAAAEHYRQFQFQAWDMIAGRLEPGLRGRAEYLDIIGMNFYDRNQWEHHGPTLARSDPRYRPFSEIAREVFERYRRPLFIAETSTEDEERPAWLAYLGSEARRAIEMGVPLEGLCWYPIADHLGWDDDRHCHNGVLTFPDDQGNREFYEPLAEEFRKQARLMNESRKSSGGAPSSDFAATASPAADTSKLDMLCFSHLRWRFVYQRPQHLLSRFARERTVFFFEEPVYEESLAAPRLKTETCPDSGVHVLTPVLPAGLTAIDSERIQADLFRNWIADLGLTDHIAWFYSPMALPIANGFQPSAVVYDCMDELSLFQGAPPELLTRERELLAKADLVFTGGYSLYEAKRDRHRHVHAFPSSVDAEHFRKARKNPPDPADQENIGRPRLGYCGVIDERIDLRLLDEIARLRPAWNFIMLGPVVKIDPAILPRRGNIHYLGGKSYGDLPAYLGNWDIALMPFALNDATRFISPTKTPEYLAAGLPVVSTPVRDVVRTYGERGHVRIAGIPDAFIAAAEAAMELDRHDPAWITRVDNVLSEMSWDSTWKQMDALIEQVLDKRAEETPSVLTRGEQHA